MNIFPFNLWTLEVLGNTPPLRKRQGPAAADALQYELKQMPTQELQQMMFSLQ